MLFLFVFPLGFYYLLVRFMGWELKVQMFLCDLAHFSDVHVFPRLHPGFITV